MCLSFKSIIINAGLTILKTKYDREKCSKNICFVSKCCDENIIPNHQFWYFVLCSD